jgi:hypothetical protein
LVRKGNKKVGKKEEEDPNWFDSLGAPKKERREVLTWLVKKVGYKGGWFIKRIKKLVKRSVKGR